MNAATFKTIAKHDQAYTLWVTPASKKKEPLNPEEVKPSAELNELLDVMNYTTAKLNVMQSKSAQIAKQNQEAKKEVKKIVPAEYHEFLDIFGKWTPAEGLPPH